MDLAQTSNASPEESLVERARHDSEAFTMLYRRHYDGVFRYCIHRLFDRPAAEDVTATVFLKVVANLDRFQGDEQAFRAWVFRIATNEINSYWRKQYRQEEALTKMIQEQTASAENGGQAQAADQQQRWLLVQRALGFLKPRHQTIIALHFTEGMKLEEIADVLGSSPGTVRSQLSRALSKLRQRLTKITRTFEIEKL